MKFVTLIGLFVCVMGCGDSGENGDAADAAPGGNCDELATPGDGNHNAGQACLNCHTGSPAPLFTIAGTLYNDVNGTAAVPGATVHVVDSDGNDIAMVTANNGNFWTTAQVAFPVTAYASLCPDRAQMGQQPTAGNCNTGGCHADGFRIHLP